MDLETLLADADSIARGVRGGFVDPSAPAVPEQPRQMSQEEWDRLNAEVAEMKRQIDEAHARTMAADKSAPQSDFVVPAPAVDDTDEIDRINAAVDALEVRLTNLKQAHAREESA